MTDYRNEAIARLERERAFRVALCGFAAIALFVLYIAANYVR